MPASLREDAKNEKFSIVWKYTKEHTFQIHFCEVWYASSHSSHVHDS